jgi:hypothetical protein
METSLLAKAIKTEDKDVYDKIVYTADNRLYLLEQIKDALSEIVLFASGYMKDIDSSLFIAKEITFGSGVNQGNMPWINTPEAVTATTKDPTDGTVPEPPVAASPRGEASGFSVRRSIKINAGGTAYGDNTYSQNRLVITDNFIEQWLIEYTTMQWLTLRGFGKEAEWYARRLFATKQNLYQAMLDLFKPVINI